MSRSFPIWVDVKSCSYKSGKSYGVKNTGTQSVFVGSSASNSHLFVSTIVTKRVDELNNRIVFKYSVDDVVLKTAYFENNNGRAGAFIYVENHLEEIKECIKN